MESGRERMYMECVRYKNVEQVCKVEYPCKNSDLNFVEAWRVQKNRTVEKPDFSCLFNLLENKEFSQGFCGAIRGTLIAVRAVSRKRSF